MLKGFKKRRLAVALSACMVMPSAAVYALGMGEIEVHSALNEPLKAQIRLLSTTAAELSALRVALASNEAFSRMGIERTAALRDLRFGVVTQGAGAPYITILSDTPIREPFLDLILMASWSNGQLMREYTLLLDPPVFDDSQAVAPVNAAKTQSAAIDRGQKKVVSTAAAAVKSAPRAVGSYGPTTRTDTLWHVAREMRPGSSVSVPQMMMALLKENPDAFIDDNVNKLKAGHILRAPSMDMINSISSSEAVAETNRHYQAWQAADVDSSPVNQRQQAAAVIAPAAPTKVAPGTAASTNARLKLLSPEDAKEQGGAGSSVGGKGGVTGQLALALETAEVAKRENADLKARLVDLESQLEAVQRLLTLKGDTLSTLQRGEGPKESAADVADPQAAVAVAPASTAAKTDSEAVAPEPTLIDQIMADPILLAAAAGGPLLLLLVVALIRRRRQAESHDVDDTSRVEPPSGFDSMPNVAKVAGGAAVVAKPVLDEQDFGEVIDEAATPDFNVSSSMGMLQAEESEIDPIAEADVYLAYRRYEQAEALLKEAIRQDGSRSELKLKLLEIYFTTKDKDAFEAQAEALYASLGGQEDDLWAQAVEMGREIAAEHPLFAEASGTPGAVVVSSVALAGLSGVAVASDKEVVSEKSPSDFADEFSFDLSDDDLASSLSISSLDDDEAAESPVELEMTEETEQNLTSLDEMDFPDEQEFSLDADVVVVDEQLETDDVIAPSGDEPLPLTSLDEFNIDGNGFDDLISGADVDQLGESQAAVDPVKGDSDDWTIAPAISSFQSRDVKTEMDGGYVPVANVVNDIAGVKNVDHLSLDESVSDQQDEEPESDIFQGADDIVGTKLDLARAYIDMGDQSGALLILDEVVKEGGSSHRQEAEQLMRQIS